MTRISIDFHWIATICIETLFNYNNYSYYMHNSFGRDRIEKHNQKQKQKRNGTKDEQKRWNYVKVSIKYMESFVWIFGFPFLITCGYNTATNNSTFFYLRGEKNVLRLWGNFIESVVFNLGEFSILSFCARCFFFKFTMLGYFFKACFSRSQFIYVFININICNKFSQNTHWIMKKEEIIKGSGFNKYDNCFFFLSSNIGLIIVLKPTFPTFVWFVFHLLVAAILVIYSIVNTGASGFCQTKKKCLWHLFVFLFHTQFFPLNFLVALFEQTHIMLYIFMYNVIEVNQ